MCQKIPVDAGRLEKTTRQSFMCQFGHLHDSALLSIIITQALRVVLVPRSPTGEGMTGICNIEPADDISACIWILQDPQPSEERKDQKPLYHIEF